MSDMSRRVVRLPSSMFDRIDQLVRTAKDTLCYKVPRATVVRAALDAWLDVADDAPKLLIMAIHKARVKRGRKPRRPPAQVRIHVEEASA